MALGKSAPLPPGNGLPPTKQTQYPDGSAGFFAASSTRSAVPGSARKSCRCQSYWVARQVWRDQLDEALLNIEEKDFWATEVPKESLSLKDFWEEQIGNMRLSRLLPRPALLPPPMRPSRPPRSEYASSSEELAPVVSDDEMVASPVCQGLFRLAAELLSNATVISLYGCSFFIQFLVFAAIGPSYQSPLSDTMMSTCSIFFGVQSAFYFTSFSAHNIGWLAGVSAAVLAISDASRRLYSFHGGLTGQAAWQRHSNNPWNFPSTILGASVITAYIFYTLAGSRCGPRARTILRQGCIGLALGLLSFMLNANDAAARSFGSAANMVRPVLIIGSRFTAMALLKYGVHVWPVQAAKELMIRAAAVTVGPYTVVGITGCYSWSQFITFALADWCLFSIRILSYLFADRYERRWPVVESNPTAREYCIRHVLLPGLASRTPHTWPQGGEGGLLWRRFCCCTELAATTGTAIACLLGCVFLSAVHPSAPLLQVYMPVGALSRQFMMVFILSQLAQDALVKVMLVQESFPTYYMYITCTLHVHYNACAGEFPPHTASFARTLPPP